MDELARKFVLGVVLMTETFQYQISGGASDRIIDVSSTLSLDRQLSMFLMQEKIMLDPSKIEINKLTHEELMDVIKV